jgi:hypothetical protein
MPGPPQNPRCAKLVYTDQLRPLLGRFITDISRAVPLAALWAHGSLALADFQLGRSDLDLVALVSTDVSSTQRRELQLLHEALIHDVPLAAKLHCCYVDRSELADVSRNHVTWAQGELFERVLSPISRRELRQGGLCLHGPPPQGLVPEVTDQELADYIRHDLQDFWYPRTDRAELWRHDIWVDLGLLTLARASVTLEEGRLITKREALGVLASLGAPADVVRDIYQRRYEAERPISDQWRARRGNLARSFVRTGIERILPTATGIRRPGAE